MGRMFLSRTLVHTSQSWLAATFPVILSRPYQHMQLGAPRHLVPETTAATPVVLASVSSINGRSNLGNAQDRCFTKGLFQGVERPLTVLGPQAGKEDLQELQNLE